jgi:hypothetical protein
MFWAGADTYCKCLPTMIILIHFDELMARCLDYGSDSVAVYHYMYQ